MAQIFVSHSQRDADVVSFFAKIFAGTAVRAVYEEIEKLVGGLVTPEKIAADIEASNAVFVLLSPNVQNLPHTRDWVVWETGVAKNRDVWVFEPVRYLRQVGVLIPSVRHYVLFPDDASAVAYVRAIIASYDDSGKLPAVVVPLAVVAGAGVAAAAAKKGQKAGAAIVGSLVGLGGSLAGLALSDPSGPRPIGRLVRCPSCASTYTVHLCQNDFRCPVCNAYLVLPHP